MSDWKRVGDYVRSRREHLDLVQGAGSVSAATWRKIENATEESYKRRTLVRICNALGWTENSIDLILEGLEPIEVGTSRTRPLSPTELLALADEVTAMRREMEQLNEAVERVQLMLSDERASARPAAPRG